MIAFDWTINLGQVATATIFVSGLIFGVGRFITSTSLSLRTNIEDRAHLRAELKYHMEVTSRKFDEQGTDIREIRSILLGSSAIYFNDGHGTPEKKR